MKNGAQWNDSGKKTFVAAEALEAARRVKINTDGKVEYADADAIGDGVTLDSCASDEEVTVALFSKPGTVPIACSVALGKGVVAYAAADGKIQPLPAGAGTYLRIGKNAGNYATTADGGIAETLITPDAGTSVVVSA